MIMLSLLFGAAGAASGGLEIKDAWVRAMPPTQRMTAAYMHLVNRLDRPLTVTGARMDDPGSVSLHRTQQQGDSVRMEAVDTLTLQPGEGVRLAPGGLHLMLMGLRTMPAEGDVLSLCLTTDAGEQCTAAVVRRQATAEHGEDEHSGSGR